MALGHPYTEVSIVNYNVSPPTDDGAQTAANTVEWAKHKDKLSDPVKTLAESTQTNITAALDKRLLNGISDKTGNYTVTTSDRGKIINFTGSSASTFTLPAAADAVTGFELIIRNFGTAVLTVDGNASETIDGSTTVDLYPGQRIIMVGDGSKWIVATKHLIPGVLAKTGAYTVVVDDNGRVIDCDASGGAFTITLPAAATAKNGFSTTIKKTDSSTNSVTIDADGSETIDGATTRVISNQNGAITVVCDGTEWFLTQGAGSGSLVLLSTATASASATIEFTDLSTTYDHYILDCINILPASDDVSISFRLSDDNGSTFKSGASDYQWGLNGNTNTASSIILNGTNSAGDKLSNVAGDFFNMRIHIWRPASSGKTHIHGNGTYRRADNLAWGVINVVGRYNTAVATDALQILLQSGNISEGQFNLYGVAK